MVNEEAMIEPLRQESFAPHIGRAFAVAGSDAAQELVLRNVEALANSPRQGGGFRLEFDGLASAALPQAIYGFSGHGVAWDLFIVPLGPGAEGRMRYEAIFF